MNGRLAAACALALTAVACGSASAAIATPTTRILDGTGFSALYPESWSLTTHTVRGATDYELSSHGALSASGVPKAGAIGITIEVVPFAAFIASGAPNPATSTVGQLVSEVVGTPPGATEVKVSDTVHTVSFAHDTAYGTSLTYTSAGTPNLQVDTVDIHAKVLYLVELDAEPSLQTSGETAMATVMKTWGWAS